jgi:WD40 repeat protein
MPMSRLRGQWPIAIALIVLLVPELSAQAPRNGQSTRTDLYGDPLPERSIARLGSVRLKHGSRTYGVVFSPDGNTIASASLDFDPVVRLWNAATGQERLGIAMGDPPAQNRTYPWRGIVTLAYSPDGKTLAGGCSHGLLCTLLWDSETGRLLHSYPSMKAGITSVAFSPDGKMLAWGSYEKSVSLAEVASGKVTHKLEGLPGIVYSVCFTLDGATLLWGSGDRTIHSCDVTSGKEMRRLEGHEKSVLCLREASDGKRLVSGGADSTARIWDLTTGKEVHCCRGHAKSVTGLAFTPDGKQFLTGSRDQTVRIWDLATGRALRTLPVLGIDVSAIALSPDGRKLAVSGYEQSVTVFDVASGEEALPRAGHRGWISSSHLSPDGKTVATGSSDGSLRLWDVQTAKELRTLSHDKDGWFIDFAFARDGRTLAASNYSNEFRLLDSETGKVLRRLAESEGYISRVRCLPDGETVVTYCFMDGNKGSRLTLWDMATGKKLWTFPGSPNVFAFSADGKTAATSEREIVLWDVSTRKETRRLRIQRPESMAFTADGKALVLVYQDGSIMLWDLASSRPRRQQKSGQRGPISHANSLALSPDSRLAATIDHERAIKLWEVATLQEVTTLQGHAGNVNMIEFAADGRTLLSCSNDGTVLVWDVLGLWATSGRPQMHLDQPQLQVLWKELSDADAARAYRSIGALVRAPQQSMPFLRERLRSVPPVEEQRIAAWVRDLDNDRFVVRKKATEELEKLGVLAEPALRKVMMEKPSLETRQRVLALLEKLGDSFGSPEGLREARAVAAIESIGNAEARELLQTLAKGAEGAWLTQDAKASLERLARHRPPHPE